MGEKVSLVDMIKRQEAIWTSLGFGPNFLWQYPLATFKLQNKSPRKPFIVVHPYSPVETKRVPEEVIVRGLHEAFGEAIPPVVILGVGTESEKKVNSRLSRLLSNSVYPPEVYDLTGCLCLPEASDVIRRSVMYLGSDSGPSHIAFSHRVKAIVVYTSTQWQFLQPQDPKMRDNIIPFYYYQSCIYSPCYSGLGAPACKVGRMCCLHLKEEIRTKELGGLIKANWPVLVTTETSPHDLESNG